MLHAKEYNQNICIYILQHYMVLFLILHLNSRGLWIYDCKSILSMDLSFCNPFLWYFSNSNTVYFCFFMKWAVLLAVQYPCFRVILMKNTFNSKNYNVALDYKHENKKDQFIYFDFILIKICLIFFVEIIFFYRFA